MWIDRIVAHVMAEVAYGTDMKAHLVNLIRTTPSDNVVEYFNTLIDRINASPYRSREVCKWLGRVRYEWGNSKAGLSDEQALMLLENIIQGRSR